MIIFRMLKASPNGFYAYLQTILLGLKGMHIEEQAQEILRSLARLSGDFKKFQEEFELVGKHLTNTNMRYDEADKRHIMSYVFHFNCCSVLDKKFSKES
jgi:DNA recombination protein RmuC